MSVSAPYKKIYLCPSKLQDLARVPEVVRVTINISGHREDPRCMIVAQHVEFWRGIIFNPH